jgi:hypothetical protein
MHWFAVVRRRAFLRGEQRGRARLEQAEARRIFAQARVAAARRALESGQAFCGDPTDEHWFDFLGALGDIWRLEASPLAREALSLQTLEELSLQTLEERAS